MNKLPLMIVLGVFLAITNQATGQTTTATPTPDPALVALQAQQAIMDAKLKIQQDQIAMTTGTLPASTTTPNSGAVTVSGTNPFPSQKLAYEELNKIADQIAGKVTGSSPVAVYDSAEINSLVNFKSISKQLNFFKDQIENLKKGSEDLDNKTKILQLLGSAGDKNFTAAVVPGLAEGSIKTAIDIIGLFRTNTNIAYSTFTADDTALTAAVVQSLLATNRDRKVYQPSVVSISALEDSSPFTDNLAFVQGRLATIQDHAAVDQALIQQISDALGVYIQASQSAQVNLELTAAQPDAAKKAEQAAKQPALNYALKVAHDYALAFFPGADSAALDIPRAIKKKADCDQFLKVMASFVLSTTTITTSFGALQTALMKVTDSGAAALAGILRAEKLAAVLKQTGAVILLVKTSVLGGSVVTRTNLWTGGHLLFTGGAIASFTVFNVDGSVSASGLVVGESGKVKDKF